eukprot:761705-Hanusia_phi.AAC.3
MLRGTAREDLACDHEEQESEGGKAGRGEEGRGGGGGRGGKGLVKLGAAHGFGSSLVSIAVSSSSTEMSEMSNAKAA